jgi:hypothetical protein
MLRSSAGKSRNEGTSWTSELVVVLGILIMGAGEYRLATFGFGIMEGVWGKRVEFVELVESVWVIERQP